MKDKIIRDTKFLFESDEDDYYEPIRIGNAFSSNYIEYESKGDENRTLSIEEYLNKVRPYLSNIINYCLNCLHSFRTENTFKKHISV